MTDSDTIIAKMHDSNEDEIDIEKDIEEDRIIRENIELRRRLEILKFQISKSENDISNLENVIEKFNK